MDDRLMTLRQIVALLLGLSMAVLTFNLGNWQTRRAEEKQALFERQAQALAAAPVSPASGNLDLDNLSYRQIELHGEYLAGSAVYIDNRQVSGRPAVQVIQAFRPEGRDFLIAVDRGYLLRDPARPREAPLLPPSQAIGPVLLKGTVLPRFAQAAELRGLWMRQVSDDPASVVVDTQNGQAVWSNFNPTLYARQLPMSLANFVVTVQSMAVDGQQGAGLSATQVDGFWQAPVALPEQVSKHRGYAFQWYGLTAVLVVLKALLLWRDMNRKSDKNT